MLIRLESEWESEEELEKQLLKSRTSIARRRRQTESEEGNSAIKHYLDRIIEKTNKQMRDRQDLRAIKDGGNKQGSGSSTGRNSLDESDKKGPANNSDSTVTMDSDEETSSVTPSLSKAVSDSTRQLQDKSNSIYIKDGRKMQELDSSLLYGKSQLHLEKIEIRWMMGTLQEINQRKTAELTYTLPTQVEGQRR